MKKHHKLILLPVIAVILSCFQACKKESEAEVCRVCIAREKLEGAPVGNEEVCSDAAEQSFRNEYAEFNVSCE